jgi:hypothetical protein
LKNGASLLIMPTIIAGVVERRLKNNAAVHVDTGITKDRTVWVLAQSFLPEARRRRRNALVQARVEGERIV